MPLPSPTWDLDPQAVYGATADGTDVDSAVTWDGLPLSRLSSSTTAQVQTTSGVKVLRSSTPGTEAYYRNTTAAAPTAPWGITTALVIDMPSTVPNNDRAARMVWGAYQGIDVRSNAGALLVQDYNGVGYPVTAGLHVLVLVQDQAGDTAWFDGEQVYALPIADARTAVGRTLSWTGDLVRAQAFDSALASADVAALTSNLGAQYGIAVTAPATQLVAEGAWDVTGTAVLTLGEPAIATLPPLAVGGAATPPPLPDPVVPAPGLPFEGLYRTSEAMPAPVLDTVGQPVDWQPSSAVDVPWARLQIVVEGIDITEYRGVRTPFPSWGRGEPFGSATCTIRLPQLSAFDPLPSWCVKDASVDVIAHLVGGGTVSLWAGVVDKLSHDEPTGDPALECRGPLLVSDLQLRKPGWDSTPKDVGLVIADVLNTAVSKRCDDIAPVVTGCLTSVLGGWEPLVVGYVQQLLSTAVTGGRQWTVRCDERTPVLVQKDTTTVGCTVSNGQRGIQVQLDRDWSQAPNVFYGEGISPEGGRWRNAVYPGWRPDSAPAWPMSPSASFSIGTADAATTSGSGVSDWQRRVGQPVTGRYSAADRERCIVVQRAAGITVDGHVGPQTWAASFAVGANTGTLDAFFMPLAYSPQVMPRLYGPDGTDLGENPAYDRSIIRVETKLDLGQGVTKDQGRQGAADMLPRVMDPGWVGRIVLEVDPPECSRFEIREGWNVQIDNFHGAPLLVHVAYVEQDEDSTTLTVDTNARDYPTLDAILARERNATDPAKSIVTRLTKASVTEARATFDDESPAGQLPRHALFPGLWTVIPVPFGAYGSIVRTVLTTSSSPSPFATAVFDRPVTAAQILAAVGNPMVYDLASPWDTFADQLDDLGLLMAWGWGNQPCGYYPLAYSTPDGTSPAPVTGRMVDDASWTYKSSRAPWLWIASYATVGCWLEGRFYPGVD